MAVIVDNYEVGVDGDHSFSDLSYMCQSFTASSAYTMTAVGLKLYKIGSPGTITVTIYLADNSTNKPTGSILATGTTSGNTLTTDTNGEWRVITFVSSIDLTNGEEYVIVCQAAGHVTSVNWIEDGSTPGYTGGQGGTSNDSGSSWLMDATRDHYFRTYGGSILGASTSPIDKTYSKQLIAIADNEVWREATAGTMSRIDVSLGELDTTDVLNAAVLAQKLFIINGTNKKVLDFVNTKITTADVGTHPPDFGTVLTSDGTGNPSMIVDYITHETANGECTIYGKRTTTVTFADGETITGTNPSTSSYAGDVSFDLNADEVAPSHWYDYTVFGNNTDNADNYGIMPSKVYQVCRYRGRIQLSGDPNYPHQWYQSRQLNPFDFLYVAGDAQSPVAGNNADCTEVGDIIKVAIPYSDDYLIYGCANEIWVMSGDAAFGGELNPLDTTTGILGDRAWCWDDKNNLYMLGTAGLLRIPAGFQQIENLTRDLWPDFVTDLAFDASLHRITLAFDPENFGIHIFKTTLTTGACVGWWYDLRTEGLFPDAIPTAMGIYSAVYYQTESPSYRKLLVGCADGYIKSFDKATKNDDGTIITSYVGFAPLALSTHPRKDGIIKNIDIVTGIGDTDSDGVTCTVHVARTAAQIIKKLNDGDTAAFTKVFITPNWSKSNLDRRSIRGQWAAIVLTNSADNKSWSMERLIVDSKEIGRSL